MAPKGAVHLCFLFSKSSFKQLIFTLLEIVKTNLQGISILPQSCLEWCLWPVTLTHIFPPCARKYQDTHEYSWGKWPTVSLFFYNLHGKFIHWIIKFLFCMKFLSCFRFPNILIDVLSLDSGIESKFLHV